MTLFKDREEAWLKLQSHIPFETFKKDWVILAISEGGVYFADKIAKKIQQPADFLFTEAIMAPHNDECILGMISETEEIIMNTPLIESFDVSLDYVYGEAKRRYDEKILSYLYKYRKGEMLKSLKGKNVLLVDQGADTGMTLMVSLKTVMSLEASKVSVAMPIVPHSIEKELEKIVDDVYFVSKIVNYTSMNDYYELLPKIDVQSYKLKQ
jgi:putative phosphoribosyl transferase